MFDQPLRDLGVEMRHISKLEYKVADEWKNKPMAEAVMAGAVELDMSDLEWADVIVYRRYYNTAIKADKWQAHALGESAGAI